MHAGRSSRDGREKSLPCRQAYGTPAEAEADEVQGVLKRPPRCGHACVVAFVLVAVGVLLLLGAPGADSDGHASPDAADVGPTDAAGGVSQDTEGASGSGSSGSGGGGGGGGGSSSSSTLTSDQTALAALLAATILRDPGPPPLPPPPPPPVWSPPPPRPQKGKAAVHLHWVDVRDGPLGHAVQDKLSFFEQTDPAFLRQCTLWVSESTVVPTDVLALRKSHGLHIHNMPELLPAKNIGKCRKKRAACNGHIGKAYALLHAIDFQQETASLVVDGNTAVCPGWIDNPVLPWLRSGKDVMWTLAFWPFHTYTEGTNTPNYRVPESSPARTRAITPSKPPRAAHAHPRQPQHSDMCTRNRRDCTDAIRWAHAHHYTPHAPRRARVNTPHAPIHI